MRNRLRTRSPIALSLVCALGVALAACGHRLVRDEWHPGVPKTSGIVDGGHQEGIWTYYFESGEKQAQGAWEHDFQTGLWTWWYPNGQTRQEGEYAGHGLDPWHFSSSPRTGIWRHFYENGQLSATGPYVADRQVGTWQYFTADGRPFATGTYSAGIKDGEWTWYGSDGATTLHGAYAMGVRTGAWTTAAPAVAAPAAPITPQARHDVAPPAAAGPAGPVAPQPPHVAAAPLAAPATTTAEIPAPAGGPPITPIATAPVAWTVRQLHDSNALIRHYSGATSQGMVAGYDPEKFGGDGDRQRHDLLGKPLPQTRFIDARGEIIDTNDRVGKRAVALIILRGFSGEVCIYCATQTSAISEAKKRFDAAGVEVIFIYPGAVESVPVFIEAVKGLHGQTPAMAVALDANLQLVHALGIEENLAKPTSILLDRHGIVRYAYVGKTIADRPSVGDLLEASAHLDK